MKRSVSLWVALSSLHAGCIADFTEPMEVTEPRLMGARVEVEGDPARPRPRLGERFALRQYLALPGPLGTPLDKRYSMELALCLGVKTPTGTLACIGDQRIVPTLTPVNDLEIVLDGLSLDPSAIQLPPELAALGGAGLGELLPTSIDRIALFGVLCVDGRAERIPGKSVTTDPPSQLFRCVDNQGAQFADPNPFTMSVYLDRGLPQDPNRNPQFACDSTAPTSACSTGVAREDEPLVPGSLVLARPKAKEAATREVVGWPALADSLTLPWLGCAQNPALLQVRVDSGEHTIRARFDPSDREQFIEEIRLNGEPSTRPARESLNMTHAATTRGGELGRFESALLDNEDDAAAEISFTYTPPETNGKDEQLVPENGRMVRFYFTVRDGRGGVDYTVRELCLVPKLNQE